MSTEVSEEELNALIMWLQEWRLTGLSCSAESLDRIKSKGNVAVLGRTVGATVCKEGGKWIFKTEFTAMQAIPRLAPPGSFYLEHHETDSVEDALNMLSAWIRRTTEKGQ